MKTRIFYRVVTPDCYSNLNSNTLESAKKNLYNFGRGLNGESSDYWEEQRQQCKIYKITETSEQV
jgi:hypothetical protein